MAWGFARRASSVQRIGDPILVKRLSTAVSLPMRILRLTLWFVGVILIIVGLARPQWGSDIEIVEQRGVQVMVALDISRSMLAQDVKPTRLDRAKLEISDLMSRLEGDSVGIVLFSGASFIQFPMTSDYATARTYVHNASPSAISRQGTVIGEAISTAMVGFSDQRVSQRVIVIMTDGESHEGDPVAAARQAAKDGAVIYTVGFGSPHSGPVPDYDERGQITGSARDSQGRTVISQLDEARCGVWRRLVEAGTSGPRRLTQWPALPARYGRTRTRPFRASSVKGRSSGCKSSFSQAHSLSSWQSWRPTACHSGTEDDECGQQRGRRMFDRRVLIAMPALALCLLACGPRPDHVNNSGHEPYLNGDYVSALDAYQKATAGAHESGEPHYNSGNALYRLEEYGESLESYDESLRYAESELRLRGFFNRGNASFQSQQYAQAIEAYKEVLRMDPDHIDAKHNLELALAQLPPPPPPQQDEQQPPQQDEQQPPQQTEPITVEQARHILETVGEDAMTLQERRRQVFVPSNPPSELDW